VSRNLLFFIEDNPAASRPLQSCPHDFTADGSEVG